MSRNDTRQRMIESAARLFQRNGYHGTSWRGLVDEASTPWGSIQHHFPGGKEELGVAAIELGANALVALIDHCFDASPSPGKAILQLFAVSGALMQKSAFCTGCPVAVIALETAPTSPALAAASRAAFLRWERAIAARLRTAAIPAARARALAQLVVTLLEGALILSRVHASGAPLASAGAHAAALIEGELAQPSRGFMRQRTSASRIAKSVHSATNGTHTSPKSPPRRTSRRKPI
jgi:TetR/AcrR family transcriptional repressor of lmrAB and yxaGH operons